MPVDESELKKLNHILNEYEKYMIANSGDFTDVLNFFLCVDMLEVQGLIKKAVRWYTQKESQTEMFEDSK